MRLQRRSKSQENLPSIEIRKTVSLEYQQKNHDKISSQYQKSFHSQSSYKQNQYSYSAQKCSKNLYSNISSALFIPLSTQDQHQTNDNRKKVNSKQFPYNVIGKITAKYSKQYSPHNKQQEKQQFVKHGMGCLIAQRIVLTSAHVVSDKFTKNKANYVQFHLKNSINNQFTVTFKAKQQNIIIHSQYLSKSRCQSQRYDIAFIILDESKLLPKVYLPIKWDYKLANYPKKLLKFVTCTSNKKQNLFELYESDNVPSEQRLSLLLYRNTTRRGDSGSPVIFTEVINSQKKYYLVGVHMGSYPDYNCCVLLNPYLKSTKQIFNEIIDSDIKLQRLLPLSEFYKDSNAQQSTGVYSKKNQQTQQSSFITRFYSFLTPSSQIIKQLQQKVESQKSLITNRQDLLYKTEKQMQRNVYKIKQQQAIICQKSLKIRHQKELLTQKQQKIKEQQQLLADKQLQIQSLIQKINQKSCLTKISECFNKIFTTQQKNNPLQIKNISSTKSNLHTETKFKEQKVQQI